jgi:hypothetical protein
VRTEEEKAMDDMWGGLAAGAVARVTGPMKFRIVLQPCMAAFLAVRAGIGDARSGRRPYFATLLADPADRIALAESGWRDVGKVFILAAAFDVVYQIIVSRHVNPLDAFMAAIVLAIVPYVILRGIVTRVVRRRIHNDLR